MARAVIGDLDRVERVVKVVGFVAADPAFTGVPQVINGASELFLTAFGDAGKHARSAVGVAVLVPLSLLWLCREVADTASDTTMAAPRT